MSRRISNNITLRLSKRVNKNEADILNLQSQISSLNFIITDSFCVIGGTTIIGEDDEENPIYGTGKALGFSYDGITYYESPTANILVEITNIDFNGYQWVATGFSSNNTNSIVLSSDGINWITPVINVLSYGIYSIAWGKKRWVAIGFADPGDARIAYSYDGMNWTDTNFTISGLNTVASNNSMFVASGYKKIATSTDGISWTDTNIESSLGANAFVKGVVWGGNIWVVTYSNVGNGLGWSTDGINWTAASTNAFLNNTPAGVVYNGTLFLAWESGGNRLAYSKNGKNWIGTIIPSVNINTVKDITWNGKYWVVVGSVSDLSQNRVAYTSDLITWYNSTSGNALYSQVEYLGGMTSRNRKNYYLTLL
jgi:hypothetical protein